MTGASCCAQLLVGGVSGVAWPAVTTCPLSPRSPGRLHRLVDGAMAHTFPPRPQPTAVHSHGIATTTMCHTGLTSASLSDVYYQLGRSPPHNLHCISH